MSVSSAATFPADGEREGLLRSGEARSPHPESLGLSENGLQPGWLIEPFERRVHVYRPSGEIELLDDPDGVDGDPFLLPGFRLDLRGIW